ncbi:MAG: TolC family protein [Planctomycetota bacterium]
MGCVCVIAATLTGCATVDPSDEEARARALIEEATGVDRLAPYDVSGEAPNPFAGNLPAPMFLDGSPALDIEEAVRIALTHNPELLAKVAEIGIAKADWVRSRWISNPSLSATALFPSGGGTVGLGGELAIEILDLWRLPIRREIADSELEQAILELAEFARRLSLETRAAFIAALEAESTLALQHRSVELARELVDLANVRREAGATTELDTSIANTEWRRSEVAALEAELAAAEARFNLERLSCRSLRNRDLNALLPASPQALPSAHELIHAAYDQRWDLRITELRLEALERTIEAEEWARFGLITGGVSAIRDPRRRGESTELNIGPTLDLELPIFHQNQPGVAAARFAFLQAVHKRNDLGNDIAHQVRVAHARYQRYAKIAAQLRDHVLVESQRRVELTQQAYEIGEATSDRVVAATRELLEAERAELEARLNLARAYNDLSAATGLPHNQLGTRPPADDSTAPTSTAPSDMSPTETAPRDASPTDSTNPERSASSSETGDRS